MAVYVNTNVSSLNGQRYLNNVQNSLNTTYQRLSSGLRINSAKDDSAGLQIADRLTSQINGLNQGNRNANDGIALAQTVEGGLDEISNMLQRMRTLAVQSANGTLGASDRTSIQNEVNSLASEISRIAEQTTFGGKTILAGYSTANAAAGETIFRTASSFGSNNTKGGSLTFHVGANTGDTIDMEVYNFMFSALASAAGVAVGANGIVQMGGTAGVFTFSVTTQCGANHSIETIDKMIAVVDSQRASANSADARSRIRDADFAEESANLSQQSIIQQAATSMLMQANTRPQLALSMLG